MTASAQSSTTAAIAARRIQYRVGHGGFHATMVNPTGAPDDRLTYVYDVGAKPDKPGYLLPAIAAFIDELDKYGTEQVDYIVLSHIDEDHVNGLGELLDALAKHTPPIAVKHVILPWLSPVQKLLTQSRNNHRQQGTAVTNLAGSDAEANAYLHRFTVENVVRSTAVGDTPEPIATSTTQQSGTPLGTPATVGWLMLPIKTPTPPGLEGLFLRELRKLLPAHLDPNSIGDHSKILPSHRRDIRSAMRSALSAHHRTATPPSTPLLNVSINDITNWSSLALLHGSAAPTSPCTLAQSSGNAEAGCVHGWLHTGDLPVNQAEVWTHLESRLKKFPLASRLCALLAPHHGSDKNHEPALYTTTNAGTVVLTTGRLKTGGYAFSLSTAKATHAASAPPTKLIDLNNTPAPRAVAKSKRAKPAKAKKKTPAV